jgi:hypothetical protein
MRLKGISMQAAKRGSGVTCGIRLAGEQKEVLRFRRDGDKTHICELGIRVWGGTPRAASARLPPAALGP